MADGGGCVCACMCVYGVSSVSVCVCVCECVYACLGCFLFVFRVCVFFHGGGCCSIVFSVYVFVFCFFEGGRDPRC